MNADEKIERLETFRAKLIQHRQSRDPELEASLRGWLHQNARWVRREVIDVSRRTTGKSLPINLPPAFFGVDPFDESMLQVRDGMSLVPTICDMIDRTIGELRDPTAAITGQSQPTVFQQRVEGTLREAEIGHVRDTGFSAQTESASSNKSEGPAAKLSDVVILRPTFMGMGIDLPKAWGWARDKLRRVRQR